MSNAIPIQQKVAIGDYDSPTHYLKINADGSINITFSGGAGASNISQVGGQAVPAGQLPVTERGSSSLATGQVSVGGSSTQIVPARAGRSSVIITMLGAVDAFVGNIGVLTTTGQLLAGTKGASITLATAAAVFGVAGSAVNVSFVELF